MNRDCPAPEFCQSGGCLGRCLIAACNPAAARRATLPARPVRTKLPRVAPSAPAKRKDRP